jgi:hypothetical protein
MKISSVSLFCCVLVLAANGCSKTSVIGESSESGAAGAQAGAPDPRDTAAEPTTTSGHRAPKVPSVISVSQGVDAFFNSPILGDVDGDGFDDFFVQGSVPERTEDVPPTTKVYLFYGRPVFSPQLTTTDADAVFNADGYVASALGDINGDGLSDFSLEGADGFALVFGSQTRYSGEHASNAVGVVWKGKRLPIPDAMGFNTLSAVRPAGDVNGDGMADLIVTSISVSAADDSQMTPDETIQPRDYLVLGHEEAWVSGEWDPSWAVAGLGSELVMDEGGFGAPFPQPLTGYAAGDLDGDGFSDLLARSTQSAFVFYGGTTQLEGELGTDRAAARFPLPSGGDLYEVGDLDADGRSDLAAGSGDTVGIVYGSTARFSGVQSVSYDFTITLNPSIGALVTAAAGDIDSDGAPELVIAGLHYAGSPSDQLTQNKFLYTVRGTGARLTGAHELSDAEGVLGPMTDFGVVTATSLAINYRDSRFSVLSLAGDVDGDGSCDILTEGAPAATGESRGSVTLIPSTPRAPD